MTAPGSPDAVPSPASLHSLPSRAPMASGTEAHALLAHRARLLASGTPDDAAGAATLVPVLVARRGAARFGMRAADVRDVRRDARVSALPGAESPAVGLVAWRGRGVVVHDPFGGGLAPSREGAVAAWLVIAGERDAELAFLVDEVEDLLSLPLDALLAAPEGAPPSLGATADGVLVLDLRGWLARFSPS